VEEKALTPQSINLIVKRRCAMAGLEPEAFSAHGLRAGYLTEAARQGMRLPGGDAAVPTSLGPAGRELLQ
jgi:site-specific recombinase XerD